MNSIPGENRELDALVNQPKETHKRGHLLGTDFRHAVEFSRSGRARTPAFWAFVRGDMSTVHRAPQRSNLGGPSGGFPGLATRSVLARCRKNSTPPMGPSAGGSAEASASRSMPSAQGIGVRRAGCGAGLQDVEVNAVRRAALPAASALFVMESGVGGLPLGGGVPTSGGIASPPNGFRTRVAAGSQTSTTSPTAGRHSSLTASGHVTGSELDADPGAHRFGGLRDAVLPRPLARATHDDQVAVPQGEPQTLPAADRAEQQRPRRPERHDGDHGVGAPSAAESVTVPGDAVAAVAVEAHAGADERLAQLG